MNRWEVLLVGKTIEEANHLLKNLGYFVTTETDLQYQNAIVVEIEKDIISEIIKTNESKN